MNTWNFRTPVRAVVVVVALALLAAAPGALAQPYRAIDLGTFDNTLVGSGFGLNNFGRAVGVSANASSEWRGLYWDGLPSPIVPLAGDSLSHAFGLNVVGQIAAMSFDLGELNVHGFVWDNGVVTDLGPLAARSINDMGVVAGYWSTSTASIALVDHAARWDGGMLMDLGTLGGSFSYASAVSNWGQIVGWSSTTNDAAVRATLWQNGQMFDLGTLGGATSQAFGISSDSGHAVGVADTAAGEPHAFLFHLSAAGSVLSRTDLGVLSGADSYAYGVNNVAQVVGTSNARAFRWVSGTMTDLNTLLPADSGWILERARAINDAGQIVGEGLHDGLPRGFLFVQVGDLNADADVDLADYAAFSICLGGPGVTTPPVSCSAYDFTMSDVDSDGDADLADFAGMQIAFGAP